MGEVYVVVGTVSPLPAVAGAAGGQTELWPLPKGVWAVWCRGRCEAVGDAWVNGEVSDVP